ncbi:hypothetical protein HPB49_001399 [Dermacentor silvarum]|uniref:Uncharacterized protein n=1 Tax=Dermacentor silvarum TaxID=543639 RepID=A0ACB8C1F5_DERSI|nr:hypothetical protein HPB49_001399 [Dermacentor silvarum]
MDKPAPVQRPTEAQCFLFNVPVSTPVDAIIDSVEEVVGAGGLQYLQHHGRKFLAAVRSAAQAAKMAAKGSLLLANKVVPVKRMVTPVVYVMVYRLPPCVSDDVLTAALSPYEKCRGLSDVVFKDRTDISNGSRLVKLEMVKSPPNFIMVTGFRVMLEYKGMKRVCSKCGRSFWSLLHVISMRPMCHFRPCQCNVPCRRCNGEHATVDCVKPRSYAAAVAPATPAQPALEDNAPEGTAQKQTTDQPGEEVSAPEVPTPASAASWCERRGVFSLY